MPRFYIEKESIDNDTVIIRGSEARHIGTVLRMKEHDCVTLFDGDGIIYTGTIIRKDPKLVQVRIDDRCAAPEKHDSALVLGQSLPKGPKMDLVVQKSTELGVARIIPFSSQRTIARYDDKKARDRVRHWQKIALESSKQSGARHIPAVEGVIPFQRVVERDFDGYLKIILWEEENAMRLRHALRAAASLKKIIFLVGPEGGFDRQEVRSAREHGFTPVSLGEAVLRTETVSLAVLAVIRYEAGDFA